ncbi:hypothetical protein LH464_05365 [Neorhizobium sp. T786]|uniref:hypothetical protein n=1 Tax=Pseudorhizobium xiangyangii TaxID=2883104 RepID=UPI001D000430|nr:hypothetical protein [Neorhizobium xiangyangii]MCB5201907.1 hypothetical protein [Neorhizobium xiangyangii]
MENAQTVSDIIKTAGGPAAIQAELEKLDHVLTRDAIYKWQKTGIPDRYWLAILKLTNFGTDQLYRANCIARGLAPIPEAAE